MINGNLVVAIVFTVLFATVLSASAKTVDVCLNPTTDARFDSTGTFFTASAPVYDGGTIAQSSSPIDCSTITAKPIGTFFTVGGLVAGLPASAAQDVAMVTWHFRLAKGAFDTIGPVQGNGAGGATPAGSLWAAKTMLLRSAAKFSRLLRSQKGVPATSNSGR